MNNASLGLILLAGGKGERMKTTTPKQFLLIEGKPIARYSFDIFLKLPFLSEIVVVCDPKFHYLFQQTSQKIGVHFANPGLRRQDSVWNGLNALQSDCQYVGIHDAARPLIDLALCQRVLQAALENDASAPGLPAKNTIKSVDQSGFVINTLERSHLWEIQTPQFIKRDLIQKGFDFVNQHQLDVTDDVSLIEHLKLPVKIVEGDPHNIKITTQEDLVIAKQWISQKEEDDARE